MRTHIRTLNWCYDSFEHLARDPNCPYYRYALKARYKKFGNWSKIWKASLREGWREVDVAGWRVPLSPKHLKMFNEGTFLLDCKRWFNWIKRYSKRIE